MAPIRPMLRDANVTEQQWRVLRVLEDQTLLDARSVASAAILHAPSVTRILRELGERGLVERSSDPNDSRRSMVNITDAGRTLLRLTAYHTRQVLDNYADAFGRERLDTLRGELAEFTRTISKFQPTE